MLLQDRVCIVTGGASLRGIGKGIGRSFAAAGARVVILDLVEAAASAAARELGGDHLGFACDVTDRAACQAAAARVLEQFGRIDVLVNNAGISQPLKLLQIEPGDYDAVLDVSLRGTLYMSQAVIPTMQAAGSGAIICMSSVSAQRGGGIFGGPHYSAAKAGVLGLAKAMARELAPAGIRVNSIAPGMVDTDITAGHITEAMRAEIIRGIPLGRLGRVEDVAGVCLFLASELSAYVTGAVLDVNGGMLIH